MSRVINCNFWVEKAIVTINPADDAGSLAHG